MNRFEKLSHIECVELSRVISVYLNNPDTNLLDSNIKILSSARQELLEHKTEIEREWAEKSVSLG